MFSFCLCALCVRELGGVKALEVNSVGVETLQEVQADVINGGYFHQ